MKMKNRRNLYIGLAVLLCLLVLVVYANRAITARALAQGNEAVPIEIGYERIAISNLQNTANGTYVYVLTDTATNREFLYVYRDGVSGCIYEIGNEVVEPRQTANPATEELIVRNELSHTGMNKGGGQ